MRIDYKHPVGSWQEKFDNVINKAKMVIYTLFAVAVLYCLVVMFLCM